MSALLEGIVTVDRSAEKKLFACLEKNALSIAVKEGSKILFHNSFQVHTSEDFVYYCLYIMNVYGLNQETTPVVLIGAIDNPSPEYNRLYKYVRKIEFIERPSILKYGFVFDEIQDHYYFDLFSLQLFE